MKKYFIFLLTIYLWSCQEKSESSKTNTHQETPVATVDKSADVALEFINDYVQNCNKMKDAQGVVEWTTASPLVTEKFKTELSRIIDEAQKDNPELGLDLDPIFDAQDYPEEGFEWDSKSDDFFVVVRGKKWKEFKLRIKVIQQQDHWLVDSCGMVNIPSGERIGRE